MQGPREAEAKAEEGATEGKTSGATKKLKRSHQKNFGDPPPPVYVKSRGGKPSVQHGFPHTAKPPKFAGTATGLANAR